MITITVRIPHQQHNTHAIRLFIIFIVLSLAIASIKSKLSTNMMMPVISIFISPLLTVFRFCGSDPGSGQPQRGRDPCFGAGLPGVAAAVGLTMIEDVPVIPDVQKAAMGVA